MAIPTGVVLADAANSLDAMIAFFGQFQKNSGPALDALRFGIKIPATQYGLFILIGQAGR